MRNTPFAGNVDRGAEIFGTVGLVAPPVAFAPATLCAHFDGNQGDDPLIVNGGTNRFQQFGMGSIERIAGGNLFLDPGSAGNENPLSTSGTIGARACEEVQGF